jgi:anthranilate synthase/aminodeoxychorismate synthase-like glutamine amidotransferase
VRELGGEPLVKRNNEWTVAEIDRVAPSHIIISPGPCTPNEAGISTDLIRRLGERIPVLGVCLGHQCIGAAYGAEIVRAKHPMHGKTSPIEHRGTGVFRGLPNPLTATRYHSLAIASDRLPSDLAVTASAPDGEIMGVAHRQFPVSGVQFHPESILTEHGYDLLRNFLSAG